MGDEDWKQQNGEQLPEDGGEDAGVGNAPWRRQAAGGNVKNVQWPPPENVQESGQFGRGRLQVQWPPAGTEEAEQQQVSRELGDYYSAPSGEDHTHGQKIYIARRNAF